MERQMQQKSTIDRRWSTIDDRWSTIDDRWSTIDDRWSIIDDPWSIIDGRWSIIDGPNFAAFGAPYIHGSAFDLRAIATRICMD